MTAALLRKYSQVFQSVTLATRAAGVYAARRRALLEGLPSLCVLSGIPHLPGSEWPWHYGFDPHIQDPAFLFLTGINQPGAFLALDPLAKHPHSQEVLFLPHKNPQREFWDGAMLGLGDSSQEQLLAEMRQLTGFSTILPSTMFWSWLQQRLHKLNRKHLFAFWHEYQDSLTGELRQWKNDHNWDFQQRIGKLLRKEFPNIQLQSIASRHMHLRTVLGPERIRMARTAQRWSRDAFIALLQKLNTLKNEGEVASQLEALLRSNSRDGIAFPTIVAAGSNACTLHYTKCDEDLPTGQLLLLDFGVRCGSLCSDISRTVPIGGRFNPLQRLLYQIVLDTQRFHQSQVKPGYTIRALNIAAWDYLESLLEKRFLSRGGKMWRQYPMPTSPTKSLTTPSKGPHGISHLIGEQVHEGDPFRTYQDLPLRPGMMLSNEPGLYGRFSIQLDGIHYDETIGIRIEDDLLVTEKGCLNLSSGVPKDPQELESLLQS